MRLLKNLRVRLAKIQYARLSCPRFRRSPGKCESDFAASTVPSYCGDPPRKFSLDGRPIAIQWCPQSDSPKATRSETRKQQPAPGVCLYSYILSCTRDSSTEKFDPPELGRVSGFKYLVQMIRYA